MASSIGYAGGKLSVGIGADQIADIEGSLAGTNADAKALIRSAINETCKHLRTNLTRGLREHLNLKAADVRERISIVQQATDDNLLGILRLDYRHVPLIDFKAKWTKAGGVTVTTVRETGPQHFAHMFKATMLSGHVDIWHRFQYEPKHLPQKGSYTLAARLKRQQEAHRIRPHKLKPVVARQSINRSVGPSVVGAFEKAPGLADAALADAGDYFAKRIASKIAWKLEGARGAEPAAAA